MAQIIGLPKLSPTMEEGVLAKWHKKEGDKISPGDVVAEVETDKANMDFPIEDEGTLLKLLVKEGETVKLGAPVAILGDEGEDVSALVKEAAGGGEGKEAEAKADSDSEPEPDSDADADADSDSEPEKKKAEPEKKPEPKAEKKPEPKAEKKPEPEKKKAEPEKKPEPKAEKKPEPKGNGKTAEAAPATGTLLASPIAKTLAAEHGVDLRKLKGSGPGGRIVERDVQAALQPADAEAEAEPAPAPEPKAPPAAARPAAAKPATPPPPVAEGEEFTDKSLSMMRKTIAKRLSESKSTIPHFYLTSDCDAAPLVAFRAAINKVLGEEAKISINDLIVKAAALALRKIPTANASFLGDRIRYHGKVHVGVAVAIDDGLITPVVRDTDQKGIRAISAEIRELAGRARARKLAPEEFSGGTFTVSNLGMYGIAHFEAIINPPEGAVLAVGAVRKLAVVVSDENGDDALTIGERMSLTLSCDHRVIDGVLGARLLQALVEILENPASLAL